MQNKGKGFTLIELIVVLVLLSILSALGIGLFSAPSRFKPAITNELWINQIRFSQRLSFVKSNLASPLTLTITRTSSQWVFNLTQGANILDSYALDHDEQTLRTSVSGALGQCDLLPAVSYPLTFRFDGMGRLITASGEWLTTNQRFCLGSNASETLCISPSGFAYGGACVP